MQRQATKNTRSPNAAEKRFMEFVKESPCIICSQSGSSIVDHCEGSTWRHNKVLCGMWYLLPYCLIHDQVKTYGSHRSHLKVFGSTQSSLWIRFIDEYPGQDEIPKDVINSIRSWNR